MPGWLSALPWLIAAAGLVVGGGGTLWFKGKYHQCTAAREADRLAAEQARSAALEAARVASDRIITEQAQAIAATANRAAPVIERIIHATVTNSCGPVVRDAARGVRDILNAGGGQAEAGGGSPAAVPTAPDRR